MIKVLTRCFENPNDLPTKYTWKGGFVVNDNAHNTSKAISSERQEF